MGEDAKKRLIWVSKADDISVIRATKARDEVALVCHLTSAEEEKQAILEFFDRHGNFDKWFFDDTNMALNIWTTELHLSFYQLSTADPKDQQML